MTATPKSCDVLCCMCCMCGMTDLSSARHRPAISPHEGSPLEGSPRAPGMERTLKNTKGE